MDSRPPNLPLLLLTCLLHFWQSARGQSSYTIDTVDLTLLPSSTVQSGTPVTLCCQVRVSHDNIPHLKHAFQLRQDDILFYSSTTKEDSITYKLDPARAADSGSYECRVTVEDKSKSSSGKKLVVAGLQTPVLYLNKTSPYESEEFTATCSAPEERGSLIFSFHQRLRGGALTRIKQTAFTGNSSETTLVLRSIGNSTLYCDYEVNLVSGFRHSNRSNEILVIVKGLYISPIMNVLPSPDVYEGEIIEVVCKVMSELKNIDVFLTRDRRILKKAPVSLSHRFTAQEGDSGKLVCKAEWGNVQKETNQTITVKELFSKPQLTVNPTDIFEGDRFKLTCSVSIYVPERISNESIQFSIYKDTVKLISAETYFTVAQPSKNGNYTCKARALSLRHRPVQKESQAVVVKAKVPVSEPMLSVVGGTLVLGKRFQLLCHSDSGTLPIIYTLNSPDRLAKSSVVSKPGEEAIFNSSAIYKTSDLNNFLCHATNGENRPPMRGTGQQLLRSTIIEPVSRPVLIVQPGAGDVSEGQDVTLVCSVQRGTLPISFTWFHTETEVFSQTSNNLKESYSISNVRGEHRGEYYCVGNNPANVTKQSLTVMIGVKMAGWKKGLIAVFVLCILLILALILIMALKRRLLLFKRKRTGELSVKSASTKTERLSLTQAAVNEAANVTPGMIGKSVWSEHASGSESEDQNSMSAPEKPPEPQYTDVQTRQADPNRAPVKKGTDTVYSEVRKSKQGVPEQGDAGAVEYAQLNHDTDRHSDRGNHGDHSVQDDHIDEIDIDSVHIGTDDHGK
ncbi:platelet endothelial cell adhesion molecule isoform X2 [Anarrhichthys ocellatus]|uniref:platelet endothelial cell adhesion molecule isoform X2 n=1 Tax=Anarrhichthys ocellatus TaxID=433405 RepID=UPI0012ED1878|nr:platelet endothelial cell adhesion molecule-like isoform X2 [Anarrhichthys ocellatus]